MITKIEIDGFKSFSSFKMEFAPLTVIAGTNASGKSNLFDAMQLLSRIVDMDLKTAFGEQRRGDATEQFTLYDNGGSTGRMSFAVELLIDKTIKDKYGGEATLKYTRLRYEIVLQQSLTDRGMQDLIVLSESLNPLRHEEDKWVSIYIPKRNLEHWRPKVITGKRGTAYIDTVDGHSISLRQDGKGGIKKEFPLNNISQAVIGIVNSVDFPHALAAKEEIKNWHFLQLNPEDLRRPSSYLAKDALTHTGENLAAVLYRISSTDKSLSKDIARRLNALLPGITNVKVIDDKVGKQFVISIMTSDGREFTSRVMSEGTLRLLTLCVFLYDPNHKGLLCFEEPENGVHPARMKITAEMLIDLVTHFEDPDEVHQRQVIVNTHSPVLVGQIFALNKPDTCRVWLSQMITQMKTVDGIKRKLQITRMLPVIKGETQMTLDFTTEEKRLTLANAVGYLENADFEQEMESLAV